MRDDGSGKKVHSATVRTQLNKEAAELEGQCLEYR